MFIPNGEDFVTKMISASKQNTQIRELFAGCVACAVAILNDEEPAEEDKEKFILCVRGYANAETFALGNNAEFYQEAMEALISHIKTNILDKQEVSNGYSDAKTDEGEE